MNHPLKAKAVSETAGEFAHLVLPHDTNILGTIFGGRVMEWIDVDAAIVAFRHCNRIAVTASMDSLHFLSPIQLGDIAILKASVNYAHRTSLEIGVRIEAENPFTQQRRHAASAYISFVALDENKVPCVIPELVLTTEEDKRRFASGQRRHEERLKERAVLKSRRK